MTRFLIFVFSFGVLVWFLHLFVMLKHFLLIISSYDSLFNEIICKNGSKLAFLIVLCHCPCVAATIIYLLISVYDFQVFVKFNKFSINFEDWLATKYSFSLFLKVSQQQKVALITLILNWFVFVCSLSRLDFLSKLIFLY